MTLHIVHLEDEPILREAIEIALKELEPDLQLKQFADSDAALQYIEQHVLAIDLFLLDIRVPGRRDGLQVAERIRELNSPGLIVFTSAYEPPSGAALATLRARYLRKPYSLEPVAKMLLEWARQEL
jgi:DNA-binding LytR/AlgR family response regulator